ncbi:MAG: holo-ACP synthase [bacterium]
MKVGIDLVHIPEMERIIGKRPRFRARLFSEREILYCESKARPGRHFAARFAAKEAFVKATGYRGPLKSIEVLLEPGGSPYLEVAGEGRGVIAGGSAALSLTHSGEYAAAVVVAAD